MAKVYVLWHKEPRYPSEKYEIKISSEKHWVNQIPQIESSGEVVMYYNNNYYLSMSRAALVKKAKEIRDGWVEEERQKIAELEAINIK